MARSAGTRDRAEVQQSDEGGVGGGERGGGLGGGLEELGVVWGYGGGESVPFVMGEGADGVQAVSFDGTHYSYQVSELRREEDVSLKVLRRLISKGRS